MKNIVILFFLCVNFAFCKGQDSSSYNFAEEIAFLNNSDSASLLSWGYGYVGSFTDNVYLIASLAKAKRYDLIKGLLDSKVASTKYLSVIVLEYAEKHNKTTLSEFEKAKIKTLYKSDESISMRSSAKDWNQSVKSLLRWSNKLIKTKRPNAVREWLDLVIQ